MQKSSLYLEVGLKWLLISLPAALAAQKPVPAQNIEKRPLQHEDVRLWRKIERPQVTPDGRWVCYGLVPVTEGDAVLCLWNAANGQTVTFERAVEAQFSADGRYLVFKVKPPLDTLKALRRRKVKSDDLPRDTLVVYALYAGGLHRIPDVHTFLLPEKWSGWLAYRLEPAREGKALPDSSTAGGSVKVKREDRQHNGSRLVLRELTTGREDTLPFALEYRFAPQNGVLLASCSGRDSSFPAGVYRFDVSERAWRPLLQVDKGRFTQLALDEQGRKAAFLFGADTAEDAGTWALYYWLEGAPTARLIADSGSAFLLQGSERWHLSEHTPVEFSEDGRMLYFGIAPPHPQPDTTRLPEEVVQVEVWAWTQTRLYTEMAKRSEAERKRGYPVVCHLESPAAGWPPPVRAFVVPGTDLPEWQFQPQRNAWLAVGATEEPYAYLKQWEGEAPRDVYAVDLNDGSRRLVVNGQRCRSYLSPQAHYILWWSFADTAWFCWEAHQGRTLRLTDNRPVAFFQERTDVPDYPPPYGLATWLADDGGVLLYDRYDIWLFDPTGRAEPRRLTRGREKRTVYRYLRLHPEEHAVAPDGRLLLHTFQEESRDEGYAWLDLKTTAIMPWLCGPFRYTRTPLKARDAEVLIFTKENYQIFPDLHRIDIPSTLSGKHMPQEQRISKANPQQEAYRWGNIELFRWLSSTGDTLEGLVVKPEGFDPNKQYPLIVNFYERLSDELHQHRAPDYHRSQINYTMYSSRGYVVFAPDIPYRIGYPGQSAYDAVVSGVLALLQQGFVDARRIGLQGHSWGGYQVAYILTRTRLFACAEAGAPVANMTSAYGGIRQESGLVRQFQYERQQSRIGGTLWEYPMRYWENSPLFFLDRVQTPLLILHNDKDGAVPWSQGVELYTGLRRLGKPVWLLNYNDEPHWPVKLQNRADFQLRMQQFFDHFLLGTPEPRWMLRGIAPAEKGIRQGLETDSP